MQLRLLGDENTSHRLVSSCCRLDPEFPLLHISAWGAGLWLGLDDVSLLACCAEHNLVLVAFDRATLAWHAGQIIRAGSDHAGVILFRRGVRSTDYGGQARVLCSFWQDACMWDWQNRLVYLPKSP